MYKIQQFYQKYSFLQNFVIANPISGTAVAAAAPITLGKYDLAN
jgi:hypothetical protein